MARPLQLQISNVGSDPYIGRLLVGRIRSGSLRRGMAVGVCAGARGERRAREQGAQGGRTQQADRSRRRQQAAAARGGSMRIARGWLRQGW